MESLDFLPLISSVWSKWVDGTSVYIWEQNLKRTKEAIKEWIKKSPQKPREEAEKYKKKLVDLQEEMETKASIIAILCRRKNTSKII
jgi:outer membrane PBP1 activator LpoA protein